MVAVLSLSRGYFEAIIFQFSFFFLSVSLSFDPLVSIWLLCLFFLVSSLVVVFLYYSILSRFLSVFLPSFYSQTPSFSLHPLVVPSRT